MTGRGTDGFDPSHILINYADGAGPERGRRVYVCDAVRLGSPMEEWEGPMKSGEGAGQERADWKRMRYGGQP